MKRLEQKAKKALFKKSKELGHGAIRGYDFDAAFNAKSFFDSFKDTGFQATQLGRAIDLVQKMRKERATIMLGFTSNMGTAGVRDIITYLVKHNLVHFVVTSTGGLEEDIIKTHGNFLHGEFSADGAWLRKNGVNRTGNIFVPNERYIWYEQFCNKVLERMYTDSKKTKKPVDGMQIVHALGKALEGTPHAKESFTYWAYKNNIPLFCEPLNDGATGDHLYFFKKDHPDFTVDMVKEVEHAYDFALTQEKIGAIIIGGSVPKHFIMNACMTREGADYTVYLNTGYEGEGSNAGANPEEAKSWGKAVHDTNTVKVWGEATITFPILVARAFKLEK